MNKTFNYSTMKVGIIGGGQLGKIMAQKAKKMGFHVTILDPTPNCPAAQVSDKQIIGGFHDPEKLAQLVNENDVTTFELEHVDTSILKKMFDEGKNIYPSPYLIELIQDKYKQKELLDKKGIPVPAYKKVDTKACLESFGFPVIQKARKGGYDGKGVVLLKTKDDLSKAIEAESFIEELVDIQKEIAVMVARNIEGEISCYPVVEMLFDERVNICDIVIAPARIEESLRKEIEDISIKCIEALDGVGIFGVELFVKGDDVYFSEVSPRPHDTGMVTMITQSASEFALHVRAVLGLPIEYVTYGAGASAAFKAKGDSFNPQIDIYDSSFTKDSIIRVFGKPQSHVGRRMAVALTFDKNSSDIALQKAKEIIGNFKDN